MSRVSSFLLLAVVMSQTSASETPPPKSFGTTQAGESVELYTLRSDAGLVARIMTYGATLVELHAPDAGGTTADVILGFDDVAGYESDDNAFFGCTTGRVCNRIANARFTLDGKEYRLAANDGPNHLHGGTTRSLDKVIWAATAFAKDDRQGVTFRYTSPDGEEGYPGTLRVEVTYSVAAGANQLMIEYRASSDRRTPVNLTNHTYFNLSGAGSETVLDHELRLNANTYTPVDDTLIPTGNVASVAGGPLDFRRPYVIGDRIEQLIGTATIGYDHNFVLNDGNDSELRTAALLKDPHSGRVLKVLTTEPAIQFYSGNFLNGQQGKGGRSYAQRSALCLETQHYPDSVNQPQFPSTILEPDDEFRSTTVLEFSAAE